eukprot:1437919-Pleurochrysis_carterae.AAC.1
MSAKATEGGRGWHDAICAQTGDGGQSAAEIERGRRIERQAEEIRKGEEERAESGMERGV